jgi:hypothetical protein
MTYGPGTTALAALTGYDAADVATKPSVALRAVADLAREQARLAAARVSDDPAVRDAAERRTAEVAAVLGQAEAGGDGPSPAADRFRARVEDALRKVLGDLESRGTSPAP